MVATISRSLLLSVLSDLVIDAIEALTRRNWSRNAKMPPLPVECVARLCAAVASAATVSGATSGYFRSFSMPDCTRLKVSSNCARTELNASLALTWRTLLRILTASLKSLRTS